MHEKSRVLILLATIPARRASVTRLLNEFVMQTRHPDGIVLVLDGYGDAQAPESPFHVVATHRTNELSGAGNRWRAVKDLLPEDIVICIDDDTMLGKASDLVRNLAFMVDSKDSAAAIMGQDLEGKMAYPGTRVQRSNIICAAACGLAVKAKHLIGVEDFAAQVHAAGGPDCLGVLGDDEALVSAFLWRNRIPIAHVLAGPITAAPGTRESSQTLARLKKHENFDVQRQLIRKVTGWPWREPKIPAMHHHLLDPRAHLRGQPIANERPAHQGGHMLRASTTNTPAPGIINTMPQGPRRIMPTVTAPPQAPLPASPASPLHNTLPKPGRVPMPAGMTQSPPAIQDASPLTRNTMPYVRAPRR